MSRSSVYDVAVLSDLRLHGGTAASLAEEVRALAGAGFTTALIHVRSTLVDGNAEVARPLCRCIAEGLADLIVGAPVDTRLAVLRPPAVFRDGLTPTVVVQADQVAIVADEATDADGSCRYDPAQVSTAVRDALGGKAVWYPLGPRARRSLAQHAPGGITLAGEDWRGPVEVDDWQVERSGREAYVARLRGLLGAPSGDARHVRLLRPAREHHRVLFLSSNGAGMGHLTRLLAMARRANAGIEPVFLSMSQAVPVVERYGFPWEYCPSRADLDVDAASWNTFFASRLVEALRTFEPEVLVFDGTWPYRGLREARAQYPDLACVWSRRPMWRADTDTGKLDHADLFDLIVEPGELAAEFDRGPTVGRGDAHAVRPVTLLSRDELLDREQARAELGMDPQVRALLVALGAGNINDIASDLDVVADEVARWEGWQVHATNAPIAWNGVVPG